MATPPVRLQERPAADILFGVLAVIALLALVAGVPYVLVRVFGSPLPEGGFSLDTLTQQAGLSTILDMLSVLVWPAWIQLVVCVAVELWSGIRRVGVPARVPFARGTQAVAHRLVTAALLLFTATAAIAPVVTAAIPAEAPAPAVSIVNANAEQTVEREVLTPVKATKKVYVAQPPHGRHHESLWEIAVRVGHPESHWTRDPQATQDIRGLGRRLADPEATVNARGAGQAQDSGEWLAGAVIPDFVAAGSLVAAGLLAALGRRRREQLWSRAFGRRAPLPTGDAALAELALLLGADQTGSRLFDVGLRHLGKDLAAKDRTPPTVFGAFLAPSHIDLWIHPADRDAPAPWTAVDGGQIWRLDAHDGLLMTEQSVSGTMAPYPGLVSIGTNEGGRVLIDLETAHGLINLQGPRQIVTAALAAVAVELATNRWSDHMKLILVGFGPELAMVAPDRITVAGSLAEALPELEARTAEVQRALAAVGADSVLTGRGRGVHREAWMPTYLLSAVPPTAEEATRLAELARIGTRLSSGYLVAGDGVPGSVWTWELNEQGRAGVKALGFDVAGQLLPEWQYTQVVELFRTAVHENMVPLSEPESSGLAAAQLHLSFRPAAEVLVLGTIQVLAPRPLEEERLALCSELVAYLATHPAGVHPRVLGGVLWPRGVQPSVRDATIVRAQEWLGMDGAGRFNLLVDAEGRLRLGPEVRVDWQVFRELLRVAWHHPASEVKALGDALELVRGPLLAAHPAGHYLWLAVDPVAPEVVARVSDAAHQLCHLRMRAGDAEGAIGAALAGLRVSEGDERLWRDLLRAAHATGEPGTLRLWAGTLRQRAATSRYWGRLVPETEALIEELLPSPVGKRAAGYHLSPLIGNRDFGV